MKKLALAAVAVTLVGGTAAVYAADHPSGAWSAPASQNVVTHRGGYTFGVHPGFSSSAQIVSSTGQHTELYRQTQTYDLPAGRTQPPTEHTIQLSGGPGARDLSLTVRDPRHQVARVKIELYDPNHAPGQHSAVTDTIIINNEPTVCPPDCGIQR